MGRPSLKHLSFRSGREYGWREKKKKILLLLFFSNIAIAIIATYHLVLLSWLEGWWTSTRKNPWVIYCTQVLRPNQVQTARMSSVSDRHFVLIQFEYSRRRLYYRH